MGTLLGSLTLSIPHTFTKLHLATPAFKSFSSCQTLFPYAACVIRNTQKLDLYNQRAQWVRIRRRAQEGDGADESLERFLEVDGSVNDMDGYLNALSLEYDSVWDTKPAWCQPWTIGLTGVLAISASWIIFESVILTTIVTSLVGAWWYIFLYSYPQAYAKMIAERRKKVRSGLEDTYGVKKAQ